ncbi:hypothetical protein QYE76_051320 [Lolium multiflorum]|uniref:Reverse transcriptase domain-containing protein n=1 Tax=Lolium multiflorum TaxID=4521 RepID=A0AAD8WIL6_LOLMU|nr:hypothetical protein QYE76_051320 [Lolium multiflorum]
MPGSGSGGRDLAAWISADVGSLLLPLLLRWSEGRAEKKIDAPFNKGVAVYLLLQHDGGGAVFFPGRPWRRESACTPAINVVEEFLAGHGGEESSAALSPTRLLHGGCCCFPVLAVVSQVLWSCICFISTAVEVVLFLGCSLAGDFCQRHRPGPASYGRRAADVGITLREGALIEFLRERWEVFAWEPSDMPEPKRKAIGEEVNRLRKAGFIRELKDNEWVANPVMVPKKDTTALRMCIDYTSLNKHCPKDHFPLPRIDQIVDSTAGCDRLSFLDAYSGYNQIKLKKEDKELTTFITSHGVYCYNVMTFGLKNAGATYQRCMQASLGEQIGRNIEVYTDDVVVKTKNSATLIDDLRESFDNLDRHKIKLNPKKCFFGVPGD